MGHKSHEEHRKKSKCIVCGQHVEEEHRLHGEHVHSNMINDLKRRFIISVILTIFTSCCIIFSFCSSSSDTILKSPNDFFLLYFFVDDF